MYLLGFLHWKRGWVRWIRGTLMIRLKIPSFIPTYLFPLAFVSVQSDCGTGHSHHKVKCSSRISVGWLNSTRSLREPPSFSFSSRSKGHCSGLWLPCLVYSHLNTKLIARRQLRESSLSSSRVIGIKRWSPRTSLVAQWLRVCLPMQGTRVRALVWEDPTCRGATTPVSHNYWACASGACAPQQERPW